MNTLVNCKHINKIDDLPLVLTVKDVQEILGICRRNAYQLCNSNEFPSKKIGTRIIVCKESFINWLQN
jgi:predicted DNA-binding transcriptional regulator AlpA